MPDVRLIDANALKKAFATDMRIVLFDGTRQGAGGFLVQRYQVVGLIDEAPTIDAVPVVRCGECKHRERNKSTLGFSWCCKFGNVMRHTDFCSWGERKMDGGAEDGSDA